MYKDSIVQILLSTTKINTNLILEYINTLVNVSALKFNGRLFDMIDGKRRDFLQELGIFPLGNGAHSRRRSPATWIHRCRVCHFALNVTPTGRVGFVADCLAVEHYFDGGACVARYALRGGGVLAGNVADDPSRVARVSVKLKWNTVLKT